MKFNIGDRVIRHVRFVYDTKNVGTITQIYHRQGRVWYLVRWPNESKKELTELHYCIEENKFYYGKDFKDKINDRIK